MHLLPLGVAGLPKKKKKKKYGFLHKPKDVYIFSISSMCPERYSSGMVAYKPFLTLRTLKLLRITE